MAERKELALDWLAFFILRRNGRLGRWAMNRVVTKWIIAPGVPLEESEEWQIVGHISEPIKFEYADSEVVW